MKVLELFAGLGSISRAFERRGHDVVSVDLDERFKGCIYRDVYSFEFEELNDFDVVWASPDCRTYSRATHCHRIGVDPISDYAIYCDCMNKEFFEKLTKINGLWFIENLRGAMRKMPFTEGLPRYMITYCQYGGQYRKETDIWTNHPNPDFRAPCKVGANCHLHSRSGNSNLHGAKRAEIPYHLAEHIVDISEEWFDD